MDVPGHRPEGPEGDGSAQDSFHRLVFGQVADPLMPLHPEAPDVSDDELTRAALADPAAFEEPMPAEEATAWRWVALLAGSALALYLVFGRRW